VRAWDPLDRARARRAIHLLCQTPCWGDDSTRRTSTLENWRRDAGEHGTKWPLRPAESLDRGALGEAGDVPDPYNLIHGHRCHEISLGCKRADMT
jgi:hypothetical protein